MISTSPTKQAFDQHSNRKNFAVSPVGQRGDRAARSQKPIGASARRLTVPRARQHLPGQDAGFYRPCTGRPV